MSEKEKRTSCTGIASHKIKTRLPLALKPSNTTRSLSSSSLDANELLALETSHTITAATQVSPVNQSSTYVPEGNKLLPNTTTSKTAKKKTKSVSKAHIIKSKNNYEDIDNESDEEPQYDLNTSIEESGGIVQFLEKPCMILYKRNLKSQG